MGAFDARNDGAALAAVLAGGRPQTTRFDGTRGLLLAVLEDGIRSYLSREGEVRREAEFWVASRRVRSPFSFEVICETLGLEPDAVRGAIQRMRTQRGEHTRALGRARPNVRRGRRLSQRGVA